MTRNTVLAILGAILLMFAAHMARYDLEPANTAGAVYRLDRWTGAVLFMQGDGAVPVQRVH